ncbi:MAG: ribosome assembly RNA-binding protein YhbY [Myxococcota bacterium]
MAETYEPELGLVAKLSPELTGKQRRHLRGLAHDLHAVVQVGQRGMSDNLIENFEAQILAHELIKVKVHDSGAMEDVAMAFHEHTGAQLVQEIGNILVFYKPHPEEPQIQLP